MPPEIFRRGYKNVRPDPRLEIGLGRSRKVVKRSKRLETCFNPECLRRRSSGRFYITVPPITTTGSIVRLGAIGIKRRRLPFSLAEKVLEDFQRIERHYFILMREAVVVAL
jgi:hypothetical protein